jgi:hypothetical protein
MRRALILVLNIEYLPTIIRATLRADLVRGFVLIALLAADEMAERYLVVLPTEKFASARKFALG